MHIGSMVFSAGMDESKDPTDNEVRIALKNVLKRKADLGKDSIVVAVVYRDLIERMNDFVKNKRSNFFESTGFYSGDPTLIVLLFMQQICIAFQQLNQDQKNMFVVGSKEVDVGGVKIDVPVFLDEPVMQTMERVIHSLGRAYESMKEEQDASGNEGISGGAESSTDGGRDEGVSPSGAEPAEGGGV